MALSNDEIELLKEIEESDVDDFYAGTLAIAFYRFQKATKLSRQIPTEFIGHIIMTTFSDIVAYHEQKSEIDNQEGSPF